MRSIRTAFSVLSFWQDLVFVEAALLAEDETKPLAALITPVLDEFPTILQRDLDTKRGVIQASARAFVADANVDLTIRRFFSAVLSLVEQDRSRQEFTTLFPSHIGEMVRHALRKQLEVAKDLAAKLALKIYPEDLRTSQTKALNSAVKRGNAVIDEIAKAEFGRVEGRIDIRTWKDEVNAARLTVYGQLLGIAAKNGRGKAWAEGFFPRASAVADEEDTGGDVSGEPGAAPEPTPAAAPKKPN